MRRLTIYITLLLVGAQFCSAQIISQSVSSVTVKKQTNHLPWKSNTAWMIYIPNIDQPEGVLQHFIAALRARDRSAVLERLDESSKPLIDACLLPDKGINHLLTMTHNLQMGLDYSVKVIIQDSEQAWVAMIPGTEPNPIFNLEGLPDAIKIDGYLFRFVKVNNDWFFDYISSQNKLNNILKVNTAPKKDKALTEFILVPSLPQKATPTVTKPSAVPAKSQKAPTAQPAAKPTPNKAVKQKSPQKLADWKLSNAVYKQPAGDFTTMVSAAQKVVSALVRGDLKALNALYLDGSVKQQKITAQQITPIQQVFGKASLKSDKPESCVKLLPWVPMWILVASAHHSANGQHISQEGVVIYQPDPARSGLLVHMVKVDGAWLLGSLPKYTSAALKCSNYTIAAKKSGITIDTTKR